MRKFENMAKAVKKSSVNLMPWQNFFSLTYSILEGSTRAGEGTTYFSSTDPNDKGLMHRKNIIDKIRRKYPDANYTVEFEAAKPVTQDDFNKKLSREFLY